MQNENSVNYCPSTDNKPQLTMEEFAASLRKQFVFQRGRGGGRTDKYYTFTDTSYTRKRFSKKHNKEKIYVYGSKNDHTAMIVFIYLAPKYGFTDNQVLGELKVKSSLFEVLRNELPNILSESYEDQTLRKLILTKIGLVRNSIRYCHNVKITI